MSYFKDIDTSMIQENERHVMHSLNDKKQPFAAKLRKIIKLAALCQAENFWTK